MVAGRSGEEASSPLPSIHSIAATSGPEFFDKFVQFLAQQLDPAVLLVSQFRREAVGRLHVLSMVATQPGTVAAMFDVQGAPCEAVLATGKTFVVDDGLGDLYGQIEFLRSLDLRSYIGVPLNDSAGNTIGTICCYFDKPLKQRELALGLLEEFSPRAAKELHNIERLQVLEAVLCAPDRSDERDLLDELAKQACMVLRCQTCFIGECLDSDPEHFRLAAFYSDGQHVDSLKGVLNPYQDTPCTALKNEDKIIIQKDLCKEFPNNEDLREACAEAYVGVTLRSRAGEPLGHIAVIHDEQFSKGMIDSPVLGVLASRAASDLERRRAEARRETAEAVMIASQKMESLGLMAGAIAHDFNNLLAAMLGRAELALEKLPQGSSAKTHLEVLEASALRARDIVKQLLDFAGQDMEHERNLADLSALANQGCDLLPRALFPDAIIETRLTNAPLPVSVDASQIIRIVLNLSLNALEALPNGEGRVVIATKTLHLKPADRAKLLFGSDKLRGDVALLEVSDTGCGMNDGDLSRILDPFYSTKPRARGLGLSAVRGILAAHGGGLGISSQARMRTTCRVFLPLAETLDESLSAGSSPLPTPAQNARRKLLLVDDQPEVRVVISGLLEHLGFDVTQAASGQEAIELIAQNNDFDGALIDVSMPNMDGWATLEALRSQETGLPIVMMSGYSEKVADARADFDGRVAFISKPFKRDQLRERLLSIGL